VRNLDCNFDDVFPDVDLARGRRVLEEDDAHWRAPGSPREIDIQPLAGTGSGEAIHLIVEEPVEVSIEAVVVTPDKIELPVVGLDHFIQQDPFHGAIVASAGAPGRD
jgi:hypothetical protein